MDRESIDVTVLFPTIALMCFPIVVEPAFALALCRAYNDWISAFCSADPLRLWAAAVVPLHQDVDAAIRELERAATRLCLRAVVVRPNPIAGRDLADPAFEPFWEKAEHLGIPVCVHEGASALVPAAGGDRFSNYLMRHLLCHPVEQMVACSAFIFGGILDRHPRLKVAFLEAGAAWAPYLLDRMDEHAAVMGHLVADNVKMKPSHYFKRQCFVSCEAEEAGLANTLELLGADNVVFASDYPHFNGRFPGATDPLRYHPRLSLASRAKILSRNGSRLFAHDDLSPFVGPSDTTAPGRLR
jgi:predicted TIM-barrel fold metal-dependent hydrolase